MKLRRLVLHNFRAIEDQELMFLPYTLIVGPNNAGKSTVLDSLRVFYDDLKFQADRDFPRFPVADQESWMELTFELSPDEHSSLANEYRGSTPELRVRKYLQTDQKLSDGKTRAGVVSAYRSDASLSGDAFYGGRGASRLGSIIYIPALSTVDDQAKLTGPSGLREIVTSIISDVVESGSAFAEFEKAVEALGTTLREETTKDGRSLAGVETEMDRALQSWNTRFQIRVSPPSSADFIKAMIQWTLVDADHDKPQDAASYGSGFQRHLVFSLIELGSRYLGKKATKKGNDFAPTMTLVLFEEPEAFLHPPQQEALARNLQQASGGEWQVVCATHSGHFVSKQSHNIPALVRLRRAGGRTSAHQISRDDWDQLVDANLAINAIAKKYPNMARSLHDDDGQAEMEAIKHFLWLNPDRSTIFFASHVLLVEGASEVALINRLVAAGKLKGDVSGLYVLDCLGKYNIHRFMNLLIRLGIPHAVIHDFDSGIDEHRDIHGLIHETAVKPLTTAIAQLTPSLEAMLNLPPAGAPHRKPQHVLFQYESGKIDAGRLDAFCRIVESCIPSPI